jgi:molecular chaperone DnaK (HSP70)
VLQGEREMAADNKVLGQFDLVGIPPAPRGVPQIEVSFDIDANGIVNVAAKDKSTGKEQTITIQSSGGLSEADIQRMVRDAEENASKDQKKKELIEAKNDAESLLYSSQKSLDEYKDKITKEVVDEITAEIKKLKERSEGEDVEAIREAIQSLQRATMKIGEAMAKNTGGGGGDGESAKSAEYTDVKPKEGGEKKD